MVVSMKTTIEIEDRLLIEAKKRAAEERRTVRALVEEGLRRVLRDPRGSVRPPLKWVVAEGGVPDEVRNREAMYDWFEKNR